MTEINEGSANVYADLGFEQADVMLLKAQLVTRLREMIEARALTQRQAARIIGIAQPRLSNVLRGQFREISEAKLMDCLARLGNDIQIVIQPRQGRASGTVSVVVRESPNRQGWAEEAQAIAAQAGDALLMGEFANAADGKLTW